MPKVDPLERRLEHAREALLRLEATVSALDPEAGAELQRISGELREAGSQLHERFERIAASVRRVELLAEAGRVLAENLTAEGVARGLARLAADGIADYGAVFLLKDDEPWLAADHGDPAAEAKGHPDVGPALTRALETGRLQVIPPLQRRRGPGRTGLIGALDRAGPRRGVVAPMVRRRECTGALVLLTREPRLRGEEALLARLLAERAVLALENARHYEAAQQASREKSEFIGVISHELRTPLTTVIGYADLLLTGIPEELPPQLKTYVERIRMSAWHQKSLVDELLTFRRLEAAKEQIYLTRLDIAPFLAEVGTLVEPAAREAGLEFRVRAASGIGQVETDAEKLRQILLNLLVNAVKYTDAGSVSLTAERSGGTVRFLVTDTGVGIAPEHLGRIFEPFWQVDQSATRRVGGSGLGLSVARAMAELLGGRILVRSTVGVGSTFELQLPAASPRQATLS